MQKQDNDKSVVHNKPEYANVQMLWWKFYWLYIIGNPGSLCVTRDII